MKLQLYSKFNVNLFFTKIENAALIENIIRLGCSSGASLR
jgi:hypothetical protein